MFKIRGSDGQEYGPVSLDQLQRWLREGRVGPPTPVQREGATDWQPLSALPEFAGTLSAPFPAGTNAELPPAVRWVAQAMFIVAGLSFLMLLLNVASIVQAIGRGNYQPPWTVWMSWGIGFLAVPLRVVLGLGLKRRREWARLVSVFFSGAMVIYGVWGLSRMLGYLLDPNAWRALLGSPMFLLSVAFSIGLLLFNAVVAVVLLRPAIRAVFKPAAPAV